MNLYRTPDASHSPRDEASRWLRAGLGGAALPPLLIVVGLLDGALIEELAAVAPGSRVLALEPDPSVQAECASRPLIAEWRQRGQLMYLAGPDFIGSDRAWRMFPPRGEGYKVLTHPRLETGHTHVVRAAQVLKTILFGVRANEEARRKFAPQFLSNVLRNSGSIAQGADLRALTDAFSGRPAIVVGAGPSLDHAIESLKASSGRGLIIAVDTALRPLLHAGIHPHLVVGADPGAANARHFRDLPDCPNTWLVAESGLDPDAARVFAGRTFWFRINRHHPWPWLNECGLEVGHLEMWGSVLTAAFQVAHLVGANPIAFVGADLAFTDRRPYARGTTYEFEWAEHVARGLALTDVWESRLSARPGVEVADVHGRPTLTTASLVAFRDWLVTRIAGCGRRVVNASGEGILHGPGIDQAMPADAHRLGDNGAPPSEILAARCRPADASVRGAFIRHLDTVRETVARPDAGAPVPAWQEFTDGRVTADILRRCLDDARRMATETGASGPVKSLFAERLAGRLAVLPEAVGRLREASLPDREVAHPSLDAHRVLDDAFSVLASMQPGQVERSAESWEWTHLAVEGLLGLARGKDPCPPELLTPRTHPERLHSNQLLAWLAVDAGSGRWPAVEGAQTEAWCAHLGHADRGEPTVASAASVCVSRRTGERMQEIVAPGGWTDAELARVMTGAWASEQPCDVELAALTRAGESLTLRLRRDGIRGAGASEGWAFPARPRVLTQHGAPRGIVAYGDGGGAVYVAPHTKESLRVTPSGEWAEHRRWPKSLIQELPLGETGAVAWSNGLADWHHPESGYVMYRRSADAPVVVEELPFRPSVGVWWNGRLYWACLPGGVGAWTGLASWAPGEGARLEVPEIALFGIEPRGDGLMLHPRALDATGGFRRERLAHGLLWVPGQAPVRTPLSHLGALSSAATAETVTATAYPEADTIVVTTPTSSRHLVCHWPHRMAWAGTSLVVSTVDWELVFFDGRSTILSV